MRIKIDLQIWISIGISVKKSFTLLRTSGFIFKYMSS